MDLSQISKTDMEMAGCLRRLFRYRYILREKNTQWFQRIIDYRQSLQDVLNTFFLTLIVDETLGVIYLREFSEEIEEGLGFRMGRIKKLGALTSLLLFQLRHERLQFYLNPEENVVPIIHHERLREFLKEFDNNVVDARFEKTFQKAIKELVELQVLIETTQNAEVFQISAVCDLLLPLDDIQAYKSKINNYFKGSSQLITDQGESQ